MIKQGKFLNLKDDLLLTAVKVNNEIEHLKKLNR